jgi:hypothetical protein
LLSKIEMAAVESVEVKADKSLEDQLAELGGYSDKDHLKTTEESARLYLFVDQNGPSEFDSGDSIDEANGAINDFCGAVDETIKEASDKLDALSTHLLLAMKRIAELEAELKAATQRSPKRRKGDDGSSV